MYRYTCSGLYGFLFGWDMATRATENVEESFKSKRENAVLEVVVVVVARMRMTNINSNSMKEEAMKGHEEKFFNNWNSEMLYGFFVCIVILCRCDAGKGGQ